MRHTKIYMFLILLILQSASIEANKPQALKVDEDQVKTWNLFTERLFELHKAQLEDRKVDTKVSFGGYRGLEKFYRQEAFYDQHSGSLLSRIQWVVDKPGVIHMIEVFVYDSQGQLQLDYLSAYLPHFRNAPIQTLINVHHRDRQLAAYRQFDASGQRIYEQCKGEFFGQALFLSLDEDDIPFGAPAFELPLYNEAYPSCFGDLVTEAGDLVNPLNLLESLFNQQWGAVVHNDNTEQAALMHAFKRKPDDVGVLTRLGIYHFNQLEFAQSIDYLSRALRIDDGYDEALFWRGMAYGRNQQHALGIADLTQYINRHPRESRAYTKRGVRYIWFGDLSSAKRDLLKAVSLDTTNAEAHDDLGVLYAQEKDYPVAISHFREALRHDPSYQKAWHNLSMVYYVTERNSDALESVDRSLALMSNKDSLLLKSLILDAMGQHANAQRIKASAAAAVDHNWSETFTIR